MIIPMPAARVTVTLPPDVVDEIDRREKNRSRFVLEAVRREVQRRRREELKRSLTNPHPESSELADAGLGEWGARSRRGESAELLDPGAGRPIRWVPGKGWVEKR
jgi:Arc/MetJ-type ribon-helix-helix transcriptional regulator